MIERARGMKENTAIVAARDRELIQRILGGERELFEQVMREHNQKLYRMARGMGVTDADADDILQAAYIQAYLKLAQFRGESSLSTWLVRIVINQCLMHLRSRTAVTPQGELGETSDHVQEPSDENESTPESEMLRKELVQVLEYAIQSLPDEYRIVYVMREMEEMSVREIALALDLTEVNVKVRLHRSRKMLKQKLEHYLKPNEIYEFGKSRCDRLVSIVLQRI